MYGVGGGHNDLLMLLVMVAGVVRAARVRERAGGASDGARRRSQADRRAAAAVRARALDGRSTRRRRRFDLAASGAAVATVAAAAILVRAVRHRILHLLSTLQTVQNEGDWHSIPGFISTRLGLGGRRPRRPARARGSCSLSSSAWLLRRVWRSADGLDRRRRLGDGSRCSSPPARCCPGTWRGCCRLSALATDRRLWKAAIIITGVVQGIQLLGYIPHGATFL